MGLELSQRGPKPVPRVVRPVARRAPERPPKPVKLPPIEFPAPTVVDGQSLLAAQYQDKLNEAESLVARRQWQQALIAWLELQAIGQQMRVRPASFHTIEARIAEARRAIEAAEEARRQAALRQQYDAKLAEAKAFMAEQKWAGALAAWIELKAIGAGLKEKPEGYDQISAYIAQVTAAMSPSRPAPPPPREPAGPLPVGWQSLVEKITFLVPAEDDRKGAMDSVLGEKEQTYYVNTLGMRFVRISSSSFQMGSPWTDRHGAANERPVHTVVISRDFYLGAHEVTVRQFETFVNATSYRTDAEEGRSAKTWTGRRWAAQKSLNWRSPGLYQSPSHPVVCVSWHDAAAFCEWLSDKEGVAYRLPTEAEWEYACRAGSFTPYWWGANEQRAGFLENVADETASEQWRVLTASRRWAPPGIFPSNDGYTFTAPVAKLRANAFGLYDMIGNVREWCQDWYSKSWYARSGKTDPRGPTRGLQRVVRGGSWAHGPLSCRSGNRYREDPKNSSTAIGLRVVVPIGPGMESE